MAIILNLETTSKSCSVCLSKNGWPWIVREDHNPNGHAELITQFIQSVLDTANIGWEEVDAIAISKGPGSYTGLRIGTSTAKGICYALNKPLLAVDTLQSLAWVSQQHYKVEKSAFISLIDARRMDVYAAVFNSKNQTVQEPYFCTVNENSFLDLLEKMDIEHLYISGDGAAKYSTLIGDNPKVTFSPIQQVSARHLPYLAEQLFQEKVFEDLAYFEPFYLKTPHITKPKKK
ncbi:MAG: tRNA (adenosine(37)-N6)-threonylcarbamoyltransferase complex dimerization subunit type 1 TsaB [Aureispira sp.]|nr:tRNA (adenosine(37)-N6)-threonylcarbamoyltransferase complex dimerization subunit type 1 TsaB [Aureispira sp.]